jgi:membrane associated rhomboid family serine protease
MERQDKGHSPRPTAAPIPTPSATHKAICKVIDNYYVLSLENLRARRYYTLLTSSLMHYQLGYLLANLVGILSFGPRIVNLYGVPTFIIIWMGSAVAGELLETYYWPKVENRYVIKKAVDASCSTV